MLKKRGGLLKNTAGENPDLIFAVIADIDQRVGMLLN